MTVDATEARITHAGEVAHWLADAASSRTTHVGGDVLHTSGVVGCYGNSAAVNHLTRSGAAVVLEPFARLPLEAFGTGAVEVLVHAVARRPILTRARITSV